MKIVITTDQVILHGGIEKVISTKANYWASEKNYEVFIMTTDQRDHIACYPLHERVKIVDLDINYNRNVSYFTFSNLCKATRHFLRQKKMLQKIQPDIIISPGPTFDYYWLPFMGHTARTIKERHSSYYAEPLLRAEASFIKKMRFLLEDWIDQKYSAIVVLNKDEYAYVRTDNAVVLHNPVDPPVQVEKTENLRVLAAGRMLPVKGFDNLVRAWALVHNSLPEWQLDIYGQDYLGNKAKLQRLIDNLGLTEHVHLKESVTDLPLIMSQYSLYAMTSETECFPMVLLEALSAGLPVVSFDCPNGPRNIITNNIDGLLIAPGNLRAFADGLLQIMKSRTTLLRMGEMAKHNSKRFKTKKVMTAWDGLFKKLLNNTLR